MSRAIGCWKGLCPALFVGNLCSVVGSTACVLRSETQVVGGELGCGSALLKQVPAGALGREGCAWCTGLGSAIPEVVCSAKLSRPARLVLGFLRKFCFASHSRQDCHPHPRGNATMWTSAAGLTVLPGPRARTHSCLKPCLIS